MTDAQTGIEHVRVDSATSWRPITAEAAPGVEVLLRWGAPAAAMAAAAIGAAYLAAWMFGAAARWSTNGVVTMKANMALSLVMSGVALLLVDPRRTSRARRTIGVALAAVVMVIGALTLLEHLFRLDFGIDQILATEPPGAAATARPNRIGPARCGQPGPARRWPARPRHAASRCLLLRAGDGQHLPRSRDRFHLGSRPVLRWVAQRDRLADGHRAAAAECRAASGGGPHGPSDCCGGTTPAAGPCAGSVPAAVLAPVVLQMLMRFGENLGLYGHAMGVGILLISFIAVISATLWRAASQLSAAAGQARVSEEEARWRADLLDLVDDAVLVWSQAQGIEGWNEGAQELYGFTAAEAVGRSPHDLLGTRGLPRDLRDRTTNYRGSDAGRESYGTSARTGARWSCRRSS